MFREGKDGVDDGLGGRGADGRIINHQLKKIRWKRTQVTN